MSDERDIPEHEEVESPAPGSIVLPCAPQPYSAAGSLFVVAGLLSVLFGLYATSRFLQPNLMQAASGVGLALLCLGFSILFDSRPPANLEFDLVSRQLVLQESFFVRAMPGVALDYESVHYIEIGEAGFRGRVPVRVHLQGGGTLSFRIAGTETPINSGFPERVGLPAKPRNLDENETFVAAPVAAAGYHDPTSGLLREYESDDVVSFLWRPRAFGRAIRFRLMSVLSLVLVIWALTPEISREVQSILFLLVAAVGLRLLYRFTRVQRQEFDLLLNDSVFELDTRWKGVHLTLPRSAVKRCVVELNPDHPERYLIFPDIQENDIQRARGIEPARSDTGEVIGVRVPVGRLTYGETIGLAARINQALSPDYLDTKS